MPHPREPCECESPGTFYSGVSGVIAAMEKGRLAPGVAVERCDSCQRFPSDAAALAKLRELGFADDEIADARTFSVHCYAVVRIKFPGIVAGDAKSAARQVLDRFDWDVHGAGAEYADDITELLVDFDSDAGFSSSCRFSSDLEEINA